MSTRHNAFITPERGIRRYRGGSFAAVITRLTPSGLRTFHVHGLTSLTDARQAHARLEAEHPPRKRGPKPRRKTAN